MKEQAENKNANGHLFKGRLARLTLVLIVVLVLSLGGLVIFLYSHHQNDQNTEKTIEEDSNLGTINAVDNTVPASGTGTIETPKVTKSATEYFDEGQAFMVSQSWTNAVSSFDQAIAIDANNPNYFNRKSQAQYNLGEKDQAIKTVKDGLVSNPNSDLLKSRLDILQKEYFNGQPQ